MPRETEIENQENSENSEKIEKIDSEPENSIPDGSNQKPGPEAPAPIDDVIRKAASEVKAASEKPLKRKRGRPAKPKPPEAPQAPAGEFGALAGTPATPVAPPPDYRPMIRDLAGFADEHLIQAFGSEAAALTEDETEQAAECLNPLLQKWFPEMGELSPELTAAFGLVMIGVSINRRVKEDRKKKAAAQAAPAPAASVSPVFRPDPWVDSRHV